MSDALTKLAEGEQLLAAATPRPWIKVALVQATRRDGKELPCRDQYSLRALMRVPCTDTESAVALFDFAHGLLEQDAAAINWVLNNADALLAGMRALVEMTQVSELTYDRPSVRIMRLMLKSAQDAVAAFTKEES